MGRIYYQDNIAQIRKILKEGGVVAFPTETVYGLGADVQQIDAIQKVYQIKSRPTNHPVIVHIDNPEKVTQLASYIPKAFWSLAKTFWPGPLTIILDKHPQIPNEVTGGQDTIAIRMPNHPITLELLRDFDWGLIGPSANRFGQISPTTATHVIKGLGDDIEGVLDGGPCQVGIESTVIQLSDEEINILRLGIISKEDLAEVVPQLEIKTPNKTSIATPGSHKLHYAPQTKLILGTTQDLPKLIEAQVQNFKKIVGFGVSKCKDIEWLQMPSTPESYAQKLYDALHQLDNLHADLIIGELPSNEEGTWGAILDRLTRAAAK